MGCVKVVYDTAQMSLTMDRPWLLLSSVIGGPMGGLMTFQSVPWAVP